MSDSTTQKIPPPDWLDKPPAQWPPEARTLFSVLGNIAERRLLRLKAAQQSQGDGRAA